MSEDFSSDDERPSYFCAMAKVQKEAEPAKPHVQLDGRSTKQQVCNDIRMIMEYFYQTEIGLAKEGENKNSDILTMTNLFFDSKKRFNGNPLEISRKTFEKKVKKENDRGGFWMPSRFVEKIMYGIMQYASPGGF